MAGGIRTAVLAANPDPARSAIAPRRMSGVRAFSAMTLDHPRIQAGPATAASHYRIRPDRQNCPGAFGWIRIDSPPVAPFNQSPLNPSADSHTMTNAVGVAGSWSRSFRKTVFSSGSRDRVPRAVSAQPRRAHGKGQSSHVTGRVGLVHHRLDLATFDILREQEH